METLFKVKEYRFQKICVTPHEKIPKMLIFNDMSYFFLLKIRWANIQCIFRKPKKRKKIFEVSGGFEPP